MAITIEKENTPIMDSLLQTEKSPSETAFELFCERFPHLALLLEEENHPCDAKPLSTFSSLTSCLYVIGISGCQEALYEWLMADPLRKVVVIETSFSAIARFLKNEMSAAFLQEKRFSIEPLLDCKQLKMFAKTLLFKHLEGNFEVVTSPSFKEKALAKRIEKTLYQVGFSLINALKEELHSPKLLMNYIANSKRAKEAFSLAPFKGAFLGVPVMICGAGPSLDQAMPVLKNLGDKALLIACGSAIAAMSKAGITPHFAMAIDPNPVEYDRLKHHQIGSVPFLYFLRLRHDVLSLFHGPHAVIGTKGLPWMMHFEKAIEEISEEIVAKMDEESCSVITVAASFALYLGCSPIYLCGVDLGFSTSATYSQGVDLSSDPQSKEIEDKIFLAKGVNRKRVQTPLKWFSEAKALSRFIRKNKKIPFINVSAGLHLGGAKVQTLSEIPFKTPFALKEKIDALIKEGTPSFNALSVNEKIAIYRQEIPSCKALLEKALSLFDPAISEPLRDVELMLLEEELGQLSLFNDFLSAQRFALQLLHPDAPHWHEKLIAYLLCSLQMIDSSLEKI